MKIKKRPLFIEKNLRTIEDVQLSLETLEHDIPTTLLQALRNFNATYLVITRNVRQHMRKNAFEHPDFLTQFDTRFAFYYFDALRLYLRNEEPSHPWRQAFKASERTAPSPFVCMALGVNAHVNHDIPLVLMDCGATKRHLRDYMRINRIIKASIDEVINGLDDSKSLFSPRRKILRPFYKPMIYLLIKVWRYNAWNRYGYLARRTISREHIEHDARRTGDMIGKMNFF